jgi:beta-lactamase superfamily II metal-dependent hydrolase
MMTTLHRFLFCLFLAAASMWGQANGKLQLHFIDVGQGDGAILISPGGQVVAFDIGQDMAAGIAIDRWRITTSLVSRISTT